MALNTEIGGPDAKAYATVAELDEYVADYGRALVDANGAEVTDTGAKEVALRQGALLLGFYAVRWPGRRSTGTQRLDWPRTAATYRDSTPIDMATIPAEVKDANCEAAVRALSNPTAVNAVINGLQTKRTQAGTLSVEYFAPEAGAEPRTIFTALDDLLDRLLTVDKSATTGTSTGSQGGFLIAGKAD